MILLIDNYDSFVYNLSRYLTEMGHATHVVRNDAISVEDAIGINPAAVVISPGPCTPQKAGISLELIRRLPSECPLLGVCLGHQAIAEAFGGQVIRAEEPMHGQTSEVFHEGAGLFEQIPSPFLATRYHSLLVEEATLPAELELTARTQEGIPMALVHRSRPVFGVQFHPESILTEHGRVLLANFLRLAGLSVPENSPEELLNPPLTRDGLIAPWEAPPPLHW